MADSDDSGYAVAGAGLLAGLISSAGSYWATRKAVANNEKWNNIALAAANTAHQREVADLYAAGLNPILSASSSGAGVPALTGSDYSNPGEGLSQGINSAVSTKLKNQALALQNAEIESKVGLNSATVANMAAQNKNLIEQNKEIAARIRNIDADTALKSEGVQSQRYKGFFGDTLHTLHSFTDDLAKSFKSDTSAKSVKDSARAGDKTPVRADKPKLKSKLPYPHFSPFIN